jgi:hypothetical protein
MRLIDADKLEKQLDNEKWMDNYDRDFIVDVALDEAPTVDAVPVVRGEWKRGREFPTYPRVPFIGTACYCSNCEGEAYWDTDYGQQLFSYCPNCGAKMEDKQ